MDGEPYQVVAESVDWNLDVSESDGEAAERELREMAGQPFSLEQAPLMRAHLWKHSQNKYTLLFNIHHIISDGWSQGVIEQELAQVYSQYAAGLEASLPPLELDYVDYAVWQRQWLQGEELEQQLAYWKESLNGAPEFLELPTDHPRPPVRTYHGRQATSGSTTRAGGKVTGTGKTRGCDPVHAAEYRLCSAPGALLPPGRCGDRFPGGEPPAKRTRRHGGILCQYAAAAGGFEW